MTEEDRAILRQLLSPGSKVFLPGSASSPDEFLRWLESEPCHTEGVELTTTLIPGINRIDVSRLHPGATLVGNFIQPDFRMLQRQGRYRHLPLTYGGLRRHVDETYRADLALCTVSEPDAQGRVSLGLSVEMTQLILGRAKRKAAFINPNMPFVPGSVCIPLFDFDDVFETAAPLATYDNGAPSDDALAIARHLAPLIEDGATLQAGLGKVPDAIVRALSDRRRLRLHSGMISDGVMALAHTGALDVDHVHATCTILGTPALYDWASRQDILAVRGCDYTHDPARMSAIDRFTAINSALAVDLFGQSDLETAAGRIVSSFGGAPDFARGARTSRRGLSVIAMPATYPAAGGSATRIVARLGADKLVSIPRNDVDAVVTEFGLADLRGKSQHERAEAIIGIAAPQFRSELSDQWREIADRI